MNTKQLAEFLGKTKKSIINHAEKIGIQFDHGVEKIYTKEEAIKIAESFYKTIPQPIRKSIDEIDYKKLHSDNSVKLHSDNSVKLHSDNSVELIKIISITVSETIRQLLPEIQKKEKQIDFIQDYYSILAYCNLKKLQITFSEAQKLGKEATKLSNENNIEIRQINDERFGKVGSYHISVLEKVFKI